MVEITIKYCDRCGDEITSMEIKKKVAVVFTEKYRFEYFDISCPYPVQGKEEIHFCGNCYESYKKWLNKN